MATESELQVEHPDSGNAGDLMSIPGKPRGEVFAVTATIVFPSILTFAYFVVFAGHPASSPIYGFGKLVQFAFPAVWVFVIARERFQWATLSKDKTESHGVLIGTVFGLLIAAATMAVALLWLKPSGFLDEPGLAIQAKIRDMHIDSPGAYLGASVFYCLVHSLLEEYYWRWFVFRRLKAFLSVWRANLISSLGFMAHHVIVLAMFFGWTSVATYALSLCVAVGGAFWAWIYERSGSLYAPWISHALIDSGIFLLGYLLTGLS